MVDLLKGGSGSECCVEGLFIGFGREGKDCVFGYIFLLSLCFCESVFGALECGGTLELLLIRSMKSVLSVLMYPKPASKSRFFFFFFSFSVLICIAGIHIKVDSLDTHYLNLDLLPIRKPRYCLMHQI